MRTVLEKWIGERVQFAIQGYPPNLVFQGKLESVDDDTAVIHQDNGTISLVVLAIVIAAHKVPNVALVQPQLEIPAGIKRAN